MKKRILTILACILMLINVFTFSACGNSGLKTKLNELETKIEQLQEKIEDLESKINENAVSGTFYSLAQAYENGLLTKEDLMSIAYYHNGGRRHNEEIMPENYAPQPKNPATLSEKTDLAIRQTFLDDYLSKYNLNNVTLDEVGANYYGFYKNCVAVKIWCTQVGYGDAIGEENVGGVCFYYTNTNRIKIWIEND